MGFAFGRPSFCNDGGDDVLEPIDGLLALDCPLGFYTISRVPNLGPLIRQFALKTLVVQVTPGSLQVILKGIKFTTPTCLDD